MNKKNVNGFSLLEVVIAMSLMSFMGLMIPSLIEPMVKSKNSLEFSESVSALSEEIRRTLATTSSCNAALGITATSNLRLTTNAPQDISIANVPSGTVAQNAKFDNLGVNVTKVFFDNVRSVGASGSNRSWIAQVMLRPTALKNTYNKSGVSDKIVTTLNILTNSANNRIISCAADEPLSSAKAACTGPTQAHGSYRFANNTPSRGCRTTFLCNNGAWSNVAANCPPPSAPAFDASALNGLRITRNRHVYGLRCSGNNCTEILVEDNSN